ncbi:hypothetical protein DPMN_165947 [Dreissena polymorpha]|uniref:Uncharacterized protein n=1 Tax=Dreissena polymorpha TaxID=45954 RepID=A0A9D4IXG6_DREPO|nr:hypothetical protein DPMN_165947 [Dreissena polymorpha]
MHTGEDSFFEIVWFTGFVPFVSTKMERILVGMKGFINLVSMELLAVMYLATTLLIPRKDGTLDGSHMLYKTHRNCKRI